MYIVEYSDRLQLACGDCTASSRSSVGLPSLTENRRSMLSHVEGAVLVAVGFMYLQVCSSVRGRTFGSDSSINTFAIHAHRSLEDNGVEPFVVVVQRANIRRARTGTVFTIQGTKAMMTLLPVVQYIFNTFPSSWCSKITLQQKLYWR